MTFTLARTQANVDVGPKKSGDSRVGQRICRLFDEWLPFVDAVMLRGIDPAEIEIPASVTEAAKQDGKPQNGKADQSP